MSTKAKGFTLVEVLVIAPVIILFIGIFVAMLVGLTGESLTVREKNVAVYDAQAAQTDIEAAVERATEFATTTGTLPMPLGKRNETTNTPTTTAFTNTPSGNFTTLILKSPTTDKSPADPTRTLIYTGTGSCNSANALYTYMTIFFTAPDRDTSDPNDTALFKRTYVPQTPACKPAWQSTSCHPDDMTAYSNTCNARDEKLVSGVTNFTVTYFTNPTTTTTYSNAAAATDVSVQINVSRQIAGNTVSYQSTSTANSINRQATPPAAPPNNPTITWTRTDTSQTPYTTTFSWARVGNANSYTVKYTSTDSTEVQQNVAQTAAGVSPSFSVTVPARKQSTSLEVIVNTSSGSFSYGSVSNTATPRWNPCPYVSGSPQWKSYGSPYQAAGFTKTKAGVVGLRGLVDGGTIGNTICTLPPEFRPSERLIFQTAGYRGGINGWARVDVLPNGNVIPITGENTWISLDGIVFIAANSGYTWSNVGFQNTWSNYVSTYGGGYATVQSTLDSEGRVHVKGLGLPGSTGSVVIGNATAARGSSPTLHLPALSGSGNCVAQVDGSGNIIGRACNSGWQSLQFAYYPPSFNSWRTMSFATTGWANYGGGWPNLQCYKGSDDLVIIRGLIARPSAPDASVITNTISNTTAPGCGRYDDGRLLLSGYGSNEALIRIDIQGQAVYGQYTQAAWNALDGVHFIAD